MEKIEMDQDHSLTGVLQPHIITSILSHIDRSTLVSCLRVSEGFHEAAGSLLYYTVKIGQPSFDQFFLGIERGASSALVGDEPKVVKPQVASNPLRWQKDKAGKSRRTAASSSTKGHAATSSVEFNAHSALMGKTGRNFKANLLAKVRTLVLEKHDPAQCRQYARHASAFTSLHALRLVCSRRHPSFSSVSTLCFPPEGLCHLIAGLNPHHLVLRNLGSGLTPLAMKEEVQWRPSNLESVTYGFPGDGRFLDEANIMMETMEGYSDISKIRIVIGMSDECTWTNSQGQDHWLAGADPKFAHLQPYMIEDAGIEDVWPIEDDELLRFLTMVITNEMKEVEVIGLEREFHMWNTEDKHNGPKDSIEKSLRTAHPRPTITLIEAATFIKESLQRWMIEEQYWSKCVRTGGL